MSKLTEADRLRIAAKQLYRDYLRTCLSIRSAYPFKGYYLFANKDLSQLYHFKTIDDVLKKCKEFYPDDWTERLSLDSYQHLGNVKHDYMFAGGEYDI